MRSEFRASTAQDLSSIADFLQRIFELEPDAPLIEPLHLQWKFWEDRADWPGSRGYIMQREGALLAHGAAVPLLYAQGTRRMKMVHLIDWAADKTSVGSGVTLLKKIVHMADAMVVAGGSAMTRRILPSLGFKPWCELTRFVLPLHPGRRIAGQKPSARTTALFLRSLLWKLQAPAGHPAGWTSRRATELSDLHRIPWPRSQADTGVMERNPEIIRYFLDCPAARFELYAAWQNGAPKGYFLLAHLPGQARLVDFYADSADLADWTAVVRLSMLQAKKNKDAAELIALGSDDLTRNALQACRFHARGAVPLQILTARGVEPPSGPARFQLLDSDAAYLHTNPPSYLA